jgi:hypothetical protein
MKASTMNWLCRVEPAGFIGHFLAHPPQGFNPLLSPSGVPGFWAPFDVLTTADAEIQRFIRRLPGYRRMRRWVTWRTLFFGATVSEYVVLPPQVSATVIVAELRNCWRSDSQLLIVKDIPVDSPLLPPDEQTAAMALLATCRDHGFILVEGQALAYVPIDFDSTDAYLARLSAGRRTDIRRKLRVRKDVGVDCLHTGDPGLEAAGLSDRLYALYEEVYAQSEIHFDKLSMEFFSAVLRDASLDGRLFLYYAPGGEVIGFNLCFVYRGMLINKYVGFHYPTAREYNLYFISWFENLSYALAHGLSHYVAGWTDAQIKSYLGASFTFTRHAVLVRNPLLRVALRGLTRHFESDRQWFDAISAGRGY